MAKCKNCKCCDIQEMVCHPEDKDCELEYKLTIEDLEIDSRCDFFIARN